MSWSIARVASRPNRCASRRNKARSSAPPIQVDDDSHIRQVDRAAGKGLHSDETLTTDDFQSGVRKTDDGVSNASRLQRPGNVGHHQRRLARRASSHSGAPRLEAGAERRHRRW
jgi:hypothetical protein